MARLGMIVVFSLIHTFSSVCVCVRALVGVTACIALLYCRQRCKFMLLALCTWWSVHVVRTQVRMYACINICTCVTEKNK